MPTSFPNAEEYLRYCRAWQTYLDKIHRDRGFTLALQRRITWARIQQFPTVWPDTCYLFTPGKVYDERVGRENFVAFVESALEEASNSID